MVFFHLVNQQIEINLPQNKKSGNSVPWPPWVKDLVLTRTQLQANNCFSKRGNRSKVPKGHLQIETLPLPEISIVKFLVIQSIFRDKGMSISLHEMLTD